MASSEIEVFEKHCSNGKWTTQVETASSETPSISLTREQVEAFHNNGFLYLKKFVASTELLELKATLESLLEKQVGSREGARVDLLGGESHKPEGSSLQLNNPMNFAPNLHRTRCFRDALSIARQLLGEDARCLWDFTILKKAKTGTSTPWHQDEASRDPRFEYNELTVWIPMQNTDANSSCLQFIPGSHLAGVLKHGSPCGDSGAHALQCEVDFDAQAAVACSLPAGGCTIHHPRTLHYAGPNSSDHSRLAYILTFGVAPKPSSTVRSFPWLEKRHTDAQRRRRQWMWRGGLFVTAWRKLRRREFKDWRSVAYGVKRSLEVLRSGR